MGNECKQCTMNEEKDYEVMSENNENEYNGEEGTDASRELITLIRNKFASVSEYIKVKEISLEEFNSRLEGNSCYYRIINQLKPQIDQIKFERDTPFQEMNPYKITNLIDNETQYYKGSFDYQGKCTGEGIWLNNYNIYYGNFFQDAFNGQGVLMNARGDYYFGDWVNGVPQGNGIIVLNGMVAYRGEFREGQKFGKGKERFPDGSYYEGEFSYGQKSGMGKYNFLKGNTYEGNMKNSQFYGEGTYNWNSGEKYVGDFINGKMNGQGTFIWNDGTSYTGHYCNNYKQGEGQYRWNDGTTYQGNWNNNLANGNGLYQAPIPGLRDNMQYVDGKVSYLIP